MKRIISAFLLSAVMMFSMIVSANAATVTAQETGFVNVYFSNGYYGFCIDRYLHGATTGDGFTVAENTSAATDNVNGNDISQQLKILFTQCFEDIFVSNGSGGYEIDSAKESDVSFAIYHFTGEQSYIWQTNKAYVEKVKAYSGDEIPDEGYSVELDNGDIVTFYFAVFEPQREDQQTFFAYKVEVSQGSTHKHDYSDDWESDDESHWHECGCGDKTDVGTHEGNTADCVNPSVCGECGKELASVNPENHTGNTVVKNSKPATEYEDGYTGDTYCEDCDVLLKKGEVISATHKHDYSDDWESDDESHWHECGCGDKTDVGNHEGNTADCVNPSVCGECGKELASVNPENHTGNTVVKNSKPATEYEDGYTGDTYCEDCEVLLKKGEIIPATHKHDYSDDWESDDESHWHECGCGDKTDVGNHEGNTADCVNPSVCDECGKELASVNPENHTGNTVVKNSKPATEYEDGYTGDTYCEDCEVLLKKGEIIPATHKHDYGDDWESDDENHWHECGCGDKTDVGNHEGNTADCVNPSVCGECGKELASVNPENHTGNTVVKNSKPATEYEDGYTGDTYCEDCDVLLKKGEIIPATHKHDYSDDWESDDESHWHECGCGDKTDKDSHTYADGACTYCGRQELTTDNGDEGDSDSDNGLNIDLDIDFDSLDISGLASVLGSLDISGIIPDSENSADNDTVTDTDSNTSTDENVNQEIPDTGSGTEAVFAYAALLLSAVSLAIVFIRKKNYIY